MGEPRISKANGNISPITFYLNLLITPADAIANHCGLIVNKMEDPVYRQKYPNSGTLSLEVSPEISSSKAWWQCA
nr:hypothetical protein [Arthrospira sp. PLM2.Bin9]